MTEAVELYQALDLSVGSMQAASRGSEHALAAGDEDEALTGAAAAVEAAEAGRWRMGPMLDRSDYASPLNKRCHASTLS